MTSPATVGGAKPSTRRAIEKSEMQYEEFRGGVRVDGQAAKRILVHTMIMVDGVKQKGGHV